MQRFLSTGILVNTLATAALLCGYALVFAWCLPQGINHGFVTWLYQRLLIVTPLVGAAFLIGRRYVKQPDLKSAHREEAPSIQDGYLLMLPLTPIARYVALNQDTLTISDSIMVFVIFGAIAALISFLIPAVLPRVGSRKVFMILGLSFSYVLFDMASLARELGWHRSGDAWIQALVFVGCFTMCLMIYTWKRTALNMLVVVAFAGVASWNLVKSEGFKNEVKGLLFTSERSDIFDSTRGKVVKRKPDILLLVYDAYVENETMLQYGIDNRSQEDYLLRSGFQIYRGTYSLGAFSNTSMSSVFDIRRATMRPWARALGMSHMTNYQRTAVSGSGAVQEILAEQGYETWGIFTGDYFFRKVGSSYQHSFPREVPKSYHVVSRAIFEGEFRFDAGVKDADYGEYVATKRVVLASASKTPRLLYTHSKYPGHSQNSGRPQGNEIEKFRKRLETANQEMWEDIETIKRHNPHAIVIVAGDHGPYLTKNCFLTGFRNQYKKGEINQLDIQDRFGSFLAIKWPEDADIDDNHINILQDIFPAVFAYVFDDDTMLNTRVERATFDALSISGVRVRNGIIEGGIDDGRFLFNSMKAGS